MDILYVYDMAIIDWFNGMTRVKDYSKFCIARNTHETFYMSPYGLKLFLARCFTALNDANIGWEGDIRGDNIALGAVPSCDNQSPFKFLALKQDNNGSSFLISEIPFHFKCKGENPSCRTVRLKRIKNFEFLIESLL